MPKAKYDVEAIRTAFAKIADRDNSDILNVFSQYPDLDMDTCIMTLESDQTEQLGKIFDEIFGDIFVEQQSFGEELDGEPNRIFSRFSLMNDEGLRVNAMLHYGDVFETEDEPENVNFYKALILGYLVKEGGNVIFEPYMMGENGPEELDPDIEPVKVGKHEAPNQNIIEEDNAPTEEQLIELIKGFENSKSDLKNLVPKLDVTKPDLNGFKIEDPFGTVEYQREECTKAFDDIFVNAKKAGHKVFDYTCFKKIKDGKTTSLIDDVKEGLSERRIGSLRNLEEYTKTAVILAFTDPDAEIVYEKNGTRYNFGAGLVKIDEDYNKVMDFNGINNESSRN